MADSIIDAVSMALNGEFGDDYEIYGEEIEQGLREPCFFITVISSSVRAYPGNRYLKRNELCIQYFPQSDAKNRECLEAADRMEQCLECIPFGDGLIRGTDMNHEMHDMVMSFFVNYSMFVTCIEDEGHMESFVSDMSVKEVE